MGLLSASPPVWIILGIFIAASPLSHSQEQSVSITGHWLLTGIHCASGKPLPPTMTFNVNDAKTTVQGGTRGVMLIDQPLQFGNNGRIEISCRGTVRSNYEVFEVDGMNINYETSVTDIAGKNCGPMAGNVTKEGGSYEVGEIQGDSWKQVLPGSEGACGVADLVISTFRRIP